MSRIYRVDMELKDSKASRLIRADNRTRAGAFAVQDFVQVRIATQDDLVDLLAHDGVTEPVVIETATESDDA